MQLPSSLRLRLRKSKPQHPSQSTQSLFSSGPLWSMSTRHWVLHVPLWVQLTFLIAFVSVISLLILAIVTITKTSSYAQSMLLSKLAMYAATEASIIEQSVDSLNSDISWMLNRPVVSNLVTALEDRRLNSTQFDQLSSYMGSVITVKPNYHAIVLYNSTFDQIYSREQGTTQLPLAALLPAITELLPLQAPASVNMTQLHTTGLLRQPIPVMSQNTVSSYILSITLPIHEPSDPVVAAQAANSNSTIVGYGTVVFSSDSLGIPSTNSQYLINGRLDIAIPVAISSASTGFQILMLDGENNNQTALDSVYSFSEFPAMLAAYALPLRSQYEQRPGGAIFHTRTIYEQDASVGYSAVDFMGVKWLVCIEMPRKAIEGDTVSLRYKLIGVCIGLLGLILLFIIPAGRIMTNPLYKIYNGMEFESSSDEKPTSIKPGPPKLSSHPSFQRVIQQQPLKSQMSPPLTPSSMSSNARIASSPPYLTDQPLKDFPSSFKTSPPQIKFTSSALNDIVAGVSSGTVNVTREGTSTLHITGNPSTLRLNSYVADEPNSGLPLPPGIERVPSTLAERGERHWYSHIRSLVVNRSQPALGPQFDHLVIDWSQGLHVPAKIPSLGRFYRDELDDLVEAYNRMIDKLNNQYTFLEDQVKVRTQEVEAAREIAEKADSAKSQFIANITHELRTPLNGIMGMTSVTLSETNLAKIRMSLQVIIESAGVLMELLNELLAFSKLQIDMTPKMSESSPLTLLESLNQMYSARASAKNVTVSYGFEPADLRSLTILCDSYRISQITSHVLSNAIKFSHENSSVSVAVRFKATVDPDISLTPYKDFFKGKPQGRFAMLEVVITDAGRGLSERQLKTVFEPFVQGDDAFNKQHQGSGLGMSMCKQLAEVIGGYVSVWSAENYGTCVIFRCPIRVEHSRIPLSVLESPPLQWAYKDLMFTSSLNAGEVAYAQSVISDPAATVDLGPGSSGGPHCDSTVVSPDDTEVDTSVGAVVYNPPIISAFPETRSLHSNLSCSGLPDRLSSSGSHRTSNPTTSIISSSERFRDSIGSLHDHGGNGPGSHHRRSIFQSFAERLLQGKGRGSINSGHSVPNSIHLRQNTLDEPAINQELQHASIMSSHSAGPSIHRDSRKSSKALSTRSAFRRSRKSNTNKDLPQIPVVPLPLTPLNAESGGRCCSESISPLSSPPEGTQTPELPLPGAGGLIVKVAKEVSESPDSIQHPPTENGLTTAMSGPHGKNLPPLRAVPAGIVVKPVSGLSQGEVLTPQDSDKSSQDARQRFLSQVHPDLKVLVADDNSLNLEIMVKMLRSIGISDIDTASNGESVVQLVEKSIKEGYHYTVIFMDLVMPVINGLDAAQIIRTTLGYPYPIIALTGFSDQQTEDMCETANIQAILVKPILRTSLADIIIKYELFTLDGSKPATSAGGNSSTTPLIYYNGSPRSTQTQPS